MKKLSLILVLAFAILPSFGSAQVVEEIVARVNNQIVTRSEFFRSKDELRDEVKKQDPANADKVYAEREKDVLRDLIDQQLLLEKAKDLSITGDTDLIKQLDQMRKEMNLPDLEALQKEAEKQGISWEDFKQQQKNQIVTRKVIGEEVGSHLSVTKEDEEKFYEAHKAEMEHPEFVRLSEILISPKMPELDKSADPNAPKTPEEIAAKQAAETAALNAAEAKANDILKQLQGGASFAELAKKYSDGPTASDGGTLGTFERGKLAKPIEDQTFALKTGQITEVMRVKQGYAILKVDDHEMAGVPPMKDVLPKIQDALYYERLQPALRTYLTKLREDAYIDIKPGYTDTGASPNQTKPVETDAAKEANAKKLGKKKHKKLGII